MRQLQDLNPVILIGDFTTLIGDPSGATARRPLPLTGRSASTRDLQGPGLQVLDACTELR